MTEEKNIKRIYYYCSQCSEEGSFRIIKDPHHTAWRVMCDYCGEIVGTFYEINC